MSDLETIASRFNDACGTLRGAPGVKLGCADRVWRVTSRTQPPPFPGVWLPCLDDSATAGVLLAALAELSDVGVGCAQGGQASLMWNVFAVRGGEMRSASHEHLGAAVALVLIEIRSGLWT